MYQKQIGSIGCPSWIHPDIDERNAKQLLDVCNVTISESHFFGADSGGDEAKNIQLVRDEVSDDWFTYAWGGACLLHQYHLMCHKSLKFADALCNLLWSIMLAPFKYFSTLVKVLHCLRDYSAKIYKHWALNYGALEARRLVWTRPPNALSGRWGQVGRGEAYVML
jgi:hypothetical protein